MLTALLASCCVWCVLVFVGCANAGDSTQAQSTEGLDTLGTIEVVAREEGSGTRDSFAQLLDFKGSEGNQNTTDLTTQDALVESDAAAVMQVVAKDTGAIGYVSAASLDEATGVTKLQVDGASVGEDNYPLSRSFYLAYQEDVSELERDFLTYILGAGQGIVGENYGMVAQETSFLSNNASGTIVVAGSTSVAPLMQNLADAYMGINPNATVVVEESDSTDGLTRAMQGTCDLGMASRDLKDYEIELLAYVEIAKDDIAVVVNNENPLTTLSSAQLKSIFTGEITSWEQLNE